MPIDLSRSLHTARGAEFRTASRPAGRPLILSYCRVFDYSCVMKSEPSALSSWTPEQIAQGKRWVETWLLASADLERIHRRELRELDTYHAIELLSGPADYKCAPRAPKPFSGLVEQQRWFMKAAGRD